MDYWNVNKLTILNKYPLLVIEALRDCVAGAKLLSKVDLKDEYHLIRMRKDDKHQTAFCMRYREYEYKVMPFGLVIAIAILQTIMNKILRKFLAHGVLVYLDDIIIYSENMEDYMTLVLQVLDRLEQHHNQSC